MSTETSTPDLDIEQSWTNPFSEGTPLYELYDRRVRNNADLIVVVSDYHNRRGTGKTVLSLQLAEGMDRTDEGLTESKVSLSPQEIRDAYYENPKGSALVLDEAEAGISNRSAMSNVNKTMREIMSMGRVEEKYLILNAPASSHIDKSVQELADVWFLVQRKGRALVHFFEYNPYGNQPLTSKEQSFEWSDIDTGTQLRDVYNYLTREKRKRIAGEDSTTYITESEHEKQLKKAVETAGRERRNEVIRAVYEHPEIDVSYRQLGESIGLAKNTIAQIINDD